MADDDRGAPIAYMVLAEGTPVQSSDGERIGAVKHVLADEGADIFDGLVLDNDRFVDAALVGDLYERLVVLTIPRAQVDELPEHTPSPAVIDVDPGDVAGDDAGGAKGTPPKGWDRLSGNY